MFVQFISIHRYCIHSQLWRPNLHDSLTEQRDGQGQGKDKDKEQDRIGYVCIQNSNSFGDILLEFSISNNSNESSIFHAFQFK